MEKARNGTTNTVNPKKIVFIYGCVPTVYDFYTFNVIVLCKYCILAFMLTGTFNSIQFNRLFILFSILDTYMFKSVAAANYLDIF